jgi:membrane protein implicated in regulation of membrane protease activity
MNPWFWAIGSVVVAVLELPTPGFYLIWIAAGGAITALAAFAFDLSLSAQVGIFAASCAVTCVCGYFVYQKLIKPDGTRAPLNERGLDMIGARGTIIEALTNGSGNVELGDSVWLAEGPDLEIGAPVIVTGVRGTVVIVAPP